MHNDAADVVGMRVPLHHLFAIVDVVDADAEVVGATGKPAVLSRNKPDAANYMTDWTKPCTGLGGGFDGSN